jgi:hypothetical protein
MQVPAQGRPAALPRRSLVAGYVRRYAARNMCLGMLPDE